ncbi:MAG: protease inhibitor I42 family protein [Anaerolineaceae bacterium]|nr:protease inhibitor I42 family protein [Anaerolineaceae bacterium]
MRRSVIIRAAICALVVLAGCARPPQGTGSADIENADDDAAGETPLPSDTAGGIAPQTVTIMISDQESVDPIQLAVGDALVVKLAGNLTTGYGWTLAPLEGEVLALEGEVAYERGNSNLKGAGEISVFTFLAVSDGDARIEFFYQRPFEKDKPPEKTVELIVKVW